MFESARLMYGTAALTIFLPSLTAAHAACSLTWGEYEVTPDGNGSADLMWSCNESMLAFQFDVSGLELIGLRDGWCGEGGWSLYNSETTAIGFTMGQAPMPPTTEPVHFVTVDFVVTGETLAFADDVIFVAPPDVVIDVDWSDVVVLNDCDAVDTEAVSSPPSPLDVTERVTSLPRGLKETCFLYCLPFFFWPLSWAASGAIAKVKASIAANAVMKVFMPSLVYLLVSIPRSLRCFLM